MEVVLVDPLYDCDNGGLDLMRVHSGHFKAYVALSEANRPDLG